MDDNCGEWVESISVVSRRWVWLLGVVVRRYIDFLILLVPTPVVSAIFSPAPLLFANFLNCFRSCSYDEIEPVYS